MNIQLVFKAFRLTLIAAIAAVMVSSCDLMHDSRKDCPEGLFINFVYDYNIHRADLFKDHVGEVTAYIFDKDGYLVTSQTESNSAGNAPLSAYGYQMHVDGLEPGDYQVLALAHQRSSQEIALTPGAKYIRTDIQKGDSLSKLYTSLQRGEWMQTSYEGLKDQVSGYRINHQSAPMDTLWHGLNTQLVSVLFEQPTYTSVNLMRNTNSLHVSLRQVVDEQALEADIADYDIYITDRNDSLDYTNKVVSTDRIVYTPYITWNTEDMTRSEGTGAPRTGHAQIDFNRLMHRGMSDNPAMLYIYNNQTKVLVTKVHLSDLLQQGRAAFDYYQYTAQQYLDREYSYNLAFYLIGDRWEYINLSVSILPWVKRIQNVDL